MILRGFAVLLLILSAAPAEAPADLNHLLIIEVRAPQARSGLAESLLARARSVAGTGAVGLVRERPATGRKASQQPSVRCFAEGPGSPSLLVTPFAISPELFALEGLTIEQGRQLTEGDRRDTPPVVLIEKSVARSLWPQTDPIGRRLVCGDHPELTPPYVVGILQERPRTGLLHADRPAIFLAFSQAPPPMRFFLIIRTTGDPAFEARRLATVVCGHDSTLLCRPLPRD